MMVPIFFVCSGIQLDVHALFGSWSGVGMMLTYAGSLLVIRGAPAFLYRNELPSPHVKALALYSATTLSLIVAITGTAVRRGLMTPQHAASLVGGGLLSVVVFPVIATRLAKHGAPAKSNEHGEA
jgi:Kef-type K+ transport system membrane component KefB